ncbi:acyl transferase 9-like [Dioscorea cayenensis subsp. rotundata]|uniref:Acyl transferase 9-like n=1 Tax=Dioscorea cayennensis subsp. rotundata TaxID=55577 RepID=A0AB40B532_DIOCR|nr:acyl transferase 9-like [Dioscorea cayenensis subsp. rotundata]
MGYSVKKSSETLIVPGEPTPAGKLSLSWIDRYPSHRGMVDTLHVFEHGHNTTPVIIKKALSQALVLYYPLAGRLVKSDSGELEVDCTGDGVLFIEAFANCTLEDVRYLELPLMISKDEILPFPLSENVKAIGALVMMQVTKFECGGYVIGLRFNHTVADGIGAAQFITAVGELARGYRQPVIGPAVWCREKLPLLKHLKPGPPPSSNTAKKLIYNTFDISNQYIDNLKMKYHLQTGLNCSKFDIMMAKVWKCRTKAIEPEPELKVHLTFAANTRHLLHQIGKGYYGNCIFPVTVSASSENIMNSSIVDIVDMIKDAKTELPAKYMKWLKGEMEMDPFQQKNEYDQYVYASDWTKVGFSEIDYGWGVPMYIGPVSMSDDIASCVLLRSPAYKDGARLITRCVKKEHLHAFQSEMMS